MYAASSRASKYMLTPVCQMVHLLPGTSSRSECTGIQGTGKLQDICCAAECCTCGGTTSSNDACLVTEIRDDPPGYCDGAEAMSEACIIEARESTVVAVNAPAWTWDLYCNILARCGILMVVFRVLAAKHFAGEITVRRVSLVMVSAAGYLSCLPRRR